MPAPILRFWFLWLPTFITWGYTPFLPNDIVVPFSAGPINAIAGDAIETTAKVQIQQKILI
jgi:hypothetical protein